MKTDHSVQSDDICALQAQLIKALHDGAGLQGLADITAEFIHGCVYVTHANGTPLAAGYVTELDDTHTQHLALYHNAQNSQNRSNDALPAPAQDATALTEESFKGSTLYQLAMPLAYGGKNAGVLSVVRLDVPLTEEDRLRLLQAASLFCVQLAQDEKIAGIELRLKGNFVEDLISARYTDPESILSRARALDYDISHAHRVLVAVIENLPQLTRHLSHDHKPPGELLALHKTDIVQSIQRRLDQTTKGMVIAEKDELVMLVQQKKGGNDIEEFKALAEKIIEDAASEFKAKLFIGIGSACTALADFSQSYLDAKKALEIGEYMITEGQVRSFEQFKVHALFLSTLKPAELYNYARGQLGDLLAYDKKHNTDFLKTLQEFLYLRNNVEGTAKSISMSVSGLKYRLQKIEKILGHDLKDYKVCFDLQLALVILQLFGEYQI